VAPVVGITSPSAQTQSPVLGVERALTTLDRAYIEGVAAAGGASVVLALQDPVHAEAVVARLDGLVLSGGGDVAPERYGATRHPAVAGVHEGREAEEDAPRSHVEGGGDAGRGTTAEGEAERARRVEGVRVAGQTCRRER